MDAVGGGTAGTSGSQSPAFGSVSNSMVTVVYGGRPFLYSLKTAWVPPGPAVTSPARLLRARAAVVPYLDPAGHVEALHAWLNASEPFSVRLIGGRGGSGKTRLAVELCRAATEEGWVAGLLGPLQPESIPTEQATGAGSDTGPGMPGMLVVIDYAEARTTELEALLLALQRAAGPARPIRVLLLVRRAPRGTAWTDVLRTGKEEELEAILDLAVPHEIILEETAWDLQYRENLYCSSWKAFTERAENADGTSPAAAVPPPDLTAASFGNPLLVAATAYLAVHDPGRSMPGTREGLLEGILDHEASHWTRSADLPADPDGTVTRRAAAMAALAGADTETEAAGLLHHVPDLQDAATGTRRAWARWYRSFYPGPRFWNPLEPDLLGEHLIATTLTEYPETLTAAIDPTRGPNTAQPLIVIARIAATTQTLNAYPGFTTAAASALQNTLPALTRAAIDEAAIPKAGLPAAGPTIAAALAQSINALSPHLEDVTGSLDTLPQPSVPYLNALALALTRHHVSWLRAHTDPGTSTADLAAYLNDLSVRLKDTGDRDGALHAIQETTALYRDLAQAHPATYTSNLAGSLNNLASRLADTGDRDGALQAIREATALYRDLAQAHPAAYTPYLASSLNNLSLRLADTGDHDGALHAIREALALHRGLADVHPAAYTPDLAGSLNNLANRLAATGDRDGALHAIREATEMYRGLADVHPAAYTPDLAGSLNNLSNHLADTGDPDGALHAIREATEMYRDLADVHPAAYNPDLATSLNNLSNRLAATGDPDGALHAIREATEMYRDLADAHPAAYNPDLAASLNNLSIHLAEIEDPDGALHAIREALDIRRRLAHAHPAAYTPDLAESLHNLSIHLTATGDRDGALHAIREATEMYRHLAQAHPAGYNPDLAGSLNNLSNRLAATGDRAGALHAIREATEMYRHLTQAQPAAYTPNLAGSLNNLSNRLAATGDHDGALHAIQEAVDIRRHLAEAHPAVYTPDLASALRMQAAVLQELGHHARAEGAREEARRLGGTGAQENQ